LLKLVDNGRKKNFKPVVSKVDSDEDTQPPPKYIPPFLSFFLTYMLVVGLKILTSLLW
jgi:hypothetical protein